MRRLPASAMGGEFSLEVVVRRWRGVGVGVASELWKGGVGGSALKLAREVVGVMPASSLWFLCDAETSLRICIVLDGVVRSGCAKSDIEAAVAVAGIVLPSAFCVVYLSEYRSILSFCAALGVLESKSMSLSTVLGSCDAVALRLVSIVGE